MTGQGHDFPIAVNAPPSRNMAEGTVVERLAATLASIRRAEIDAERPSGCVSLVAVSKTIPADVILPALEAGQKLFGENYVQESQAKWPPLRERFPGTELHLVGPLQSNKANDAVALFDVIHSVDRASLAQALARAIQRSGRQPRLLIQVNTGDETQKSGVGTSDAEAFLEACRRDYGLRIAGLMCIPPAEQAPSPHFAFLRKLAEANGLPLLSMGMSADYAAAIQLGATHVRIGTAIFGARATRLSTR